jgi:uncharacterized protein (DUF1015 family)
MATIRPFAGIRYSATAGHDLSDFIAPPYDVLDAASKAQLLARSPFNIVAIDLPHVPPKQLGPPAAYAQAAQTMEAWLASGVLVRDGRRALYPYEQSYQYKGRTFHRRGVIALVKLTPFGVDVIPHEKTYDGPIEDRLQLMHSTGAQLSPVFGLFMDASNGFLKTIFANVSQPMQTATLDGVTSKVWSLTDAAVEDGLLMDFEDKKVYIADGHHRYTTALHYQREAEQKHGGPLPPDHPANYCMFVLVNGEDPTLQILPTHRLVGGLTNWDADAFIRAIEPYFTVTRTTLRADHVDELAQTLPGYGRNAIGMYDGRTRGLFVLTLKDGELMRRLEPDKSDAWRGLDVAILQRYLFDEVLAASFGGAGMTRGYTADEHAVAPQVDSGAFQVGFLLQPTPIRALTELGDRGEVMPQKSTFFFPKLATGLVINPLR